MADERMITAKSLLLGFLDLRSLSPDFADWSEERLGNNPPRLFRLRQLIAMFSAFEIPWDPKSFVKGWFIDPQQTRYSAVFSKLVAEATNLPGPPVGAYQLPYFFATLFRYRERLERVLSFSSGFLEVSGLSFHALRKTDKLNQVIHDNLAEIDSYLMVLINPEGAEFSIEQLKRDYAYPDVDMLDIDTDWF